MNEEWVDPEGLELYHDPDVWQVLALDPGGTTGWAIVQVHPDAMTGDPEVPAFTNIQWWTAGQFTGQQHDQIDQIVNLVQEWPYARLVTEDFKVAKAGVLLDPAEINAAVTWATRPRYWVKQMSSLAMGTVTDQRQKDWGFWIPGKEHARDAVKHAITFLKRRKEQEIQTARRNRRAAS